MLTIVGIVIKERPVGEQDKFIDVLTSNDGVIEITVKGARKINGKNSSSSQLFAYSRFCIQLRSDRYYLNSAEPICIFYGLRNSIEKISLASYFSEIVKCSVGNQNDENDILRLLLNTLHFLENDSRDKNLLKCIFELRFLTEIGLMPDILCCSVCGEFEPQKIVFLVRDGNFCCAGCFEGDLENPDFVSANAAVLHAVRHIVLSDFKRLFNFKISETALKKLSEFSERYTIEHLDRNFRTLEFYKSIQTL